MKKELIRRLDSKQLVLKGVFIMQKIESLLNTLEIAEMLEIEHWQLLRKLNGRTGTNGNHIKGYVEILGDNQVVVTDFFRESTYRTEQNKEMPCYQVTRKGCEFLTNKFTGEKGVLFTARYINKFHEMQVELAVKQDRDELAELREALKEQGKMLNSINRLLAGNRITGIGRRTEKDIYKAEIAQIVETMDNTEALCKVCTFAKYIPQ